MHEASADGLRQLLDKHHRALSDEFTLLLDSNVRAAVESERTRCAESLNQMLRRIRHVGSASEVLNLIRNEASAPETQAVVMAVESGQAASISPAEPVTFELSSARALAAVVESRDPVVTILSETELGAELAHLFTAMPGRDASQGKAYLFPVTVRQEVTAMLIVAGGVAPASPELLCEAAGLRLEALTAPPAAPAPGLVRINEHPDVPASETGGPRSWTDLSSEDQKLHLQAQRVARVKVAEMRLDHADALRRGTFEGDIYTALRGEIDAARAQFLQSFLAQSATMVDYLHLEIMRSLAHDDDRLLGKEYPGPMV